MSLTRRHKTVVFTFYFKWLDGLTLTPWQQDKKPLTFDMKRHSSAERTTHQLAQVVLHLNRRPVESQPNTTSWYRHAACFNLSRQRCPVLWTSHPSCSFPSWVERSHRSGRQSGTQLTFSAHFSDYSALQLCLAAKQLLQRQRVTTLPSLVNFCF